MKPTLVPKKNNVSGHQACSTGRNNKKIGKMVVSFSVFFLPLHNYAIRLYMTLYTYRYIYSENSCSWLVSAGVFV